MRPYEAMRQLVRGTVGSLVGERVRPEILAVGDTLPACILSLTEHRPVIGLDRRLLDVYRFRVTCLASTRSGADTVAGELQMMDGRTLPDGPHVWTVHVIGGAADTATIEAEASEAVYAAYVDVNLIRT